VNSLSLSMGDASLQVVLVEASAALWARPPGGMCARGLGELCHTLSSFLEAHLALHRRNAAAIFAYSPSESSLILDTRRQSKSTLDALLSLLPPILQRDSSSFPDEPTPLSGVLSQALCACSRELDCSSDSLSGSGDPSHQNAFSTDGSSSTARRPRVLCVSGSSDPTEQYVPIMNCLFSAQRLGARIDTLRIGTSDSPFLQQAAHLTGAAYVKPCRPENVLQHMLARFAPDEVSGSLLCRVPPPAVDFRASCFCHQKPVDIGRVCSACLSIFCEDVDRCSTCGVNFSNSSALT